MFRFKRSSICTIGLVLLTIANCGLYLWEPASLLVIRNNLFDRYQQWQPREYQDVGVRIVDIDDVSLQKIGQWPWPRTRVAALLNNLDAAQVKAVGFDVIFAEPDRTSPSAVLKYWQVSPEVRLQLQALPDPDQVLADALKRHPAVLGFAAEHGRTAQTLPNQPFRFITIGDGVDDFTTHFTSTIQSISVLEQAVQGNGALIFTPDLDGMLRRVPLVVQIREQLYPSFAAELLRVALQQKNYLLRSSAKHVTGVEELAINDFHIPTTAQGDMWVYYTKPEPSRIIPAWKILNGEIPAGQLKNTILLVGASAKGLMDLHFTPVAGIIPGIEVHAQIMEQMLTRNFLIRPNWAFSLELISLLSGSLLVGLVALNCRVLIALSIFLSLVTLMLSGSCAAFKSQGLLLDGFTPGLLIMLVFVLSNLIRHFHSEQQQRWIRTVFSRYVSPNLVNYLIANPKQLELSGKRLECSFILTDLANSTKFMESAEPGRVASLLNVYLDQMISIAFRHDGTLTRIIGDGIVIMFSAPVHQADHRQRAVLCALEMHTFAKNYVAELKAQGTEFCETRIGVNTGMVLVGNFGGQSIFDYRALGDPINTASRLESVNRYLGTGICVSETTLDGCDNAVSRPIGRLLLKGKTKAFLAYELLGVNTEHSKVLRDSEYEQAYQFLANNRLAAALDAFTKLLRQRPQDGLVAFHVERLQRGEQGDLVVIADK